MSLDLATRLREGTKHSHTMAENTAFMKCFLKGIVEWEPFRKLTADLYFVYNTLETEIRRHQEHPIVGKIYFRELERREKLEQDLAYYYSDNWRNEIVASQEGQAYVTHILEISKTNPALLVAHSYVRYMGDLSGGQSLRKIVRSALTLPADRGTGLHEFDQLPTPEARREFKAKYRDALNSLPINETLAEQIVDEANYAFELNRNVFHELEPAVKTAVGEHVFDLITRQDRPGSTERQVGNISVELVAAE
jgi:heme oxygenase